MHSGGGVGTWGKRGNLFGGGRNGKGDAERAVWLEGVEGGRTRTTQLQGKGSTLLILLVALGDSADSTIDQ